jgi:hypothetical protein
MSVQNDKNSKTFTFATAISAYRMVKPDTTAGQAVVAASGADTAIGVVQDDVAANGSAEVKLFFPTFFATVSGTCAAGDKVKFDAAGQVSTAAANTIVAGVALEAATSTSAVVEIAIPLVH